MKKPTLERSGSLVSPLDGEAFDVNGSFVSTLDEDGFDVSWSPVSPLDGDGLDVFRNMYITVLQPQTQLIPRKSKKKQNDTTLAHNYAKCRPIFEILSPLHSAVNM